VEPTAICFVVTVIGVAFTTLSSSATSAVTTRPFGVTVRRAAYPPANNLRLRSGQVRPAATGCSGLPGPGAFIGGSDHNVAPVTDGAVLGGSSNEVCGPYFGIGTG
jgi:hypothetical protein